MPLRLPICSTLLLLSLVALLHSASGEWFDKQAPASNCPVTTPRIRRSWFTLSHDEKSQYQQLVLRMKKDIFFPRNSTSTSAIYDFFVYIHLLGANALHWHGTSFFLPAHRYYLYKFESALRWMARKYAKEISPPIVDPCAVAVPYWPWEEDFKKKDDPAFPQYTSKFWEGGYLGKCKRGEAEAPFNNATWRTVTPLNTCENVTCWDKEKVEKLVNTLKRVFLPSVPFVYGPLQIADLIVNGSKFYNFSQGIEGPHSTVHRWFGAQMGTTSSPDDPVFFLHHCNIDRLWALQQDCHGYEFVPPKDLDNPIYYTNVTKYEDKTNIPLGNYTIDDIIPFWWSAKKDSYAIPEGRFPRPRDVWSLGCLKWPTFDDMYVRYGPDSLIPLLNATCPDKTWTLTNQPYFTTTKRGLVQNFTFTYDNSFYKIMDMAVQLAKDLQAQGNSSQAALQRAAFAECSLTPKVVIDGNFLDWIKLQGTKIEQYDRLCDSTSTEFFCRGLGRRLLKCPTSLKEETKGVDTTHETRNPIAAVGVLGGVVVAVVGIVFAVVKYVKGKELEETADYQDLSG